MNRSTAAKSKQLQMPFGTACNRLRKSLLFQLAQQCGRAVCHRCQQPITDVAHFSIDHMVPWEKSDTPAYLFFDLSNIGFSHLFCNVSHRRSRIGQGPAVTREKAAAYMRSVYTTERRREKKRRTGH